MAAAGSLTVNGQVTGLPSGRFDIATEKVESAAAIGTRSLVNLANGNNTITPPTGYTSIIIIPPAGNANAIVLKGVNGDTGVRLHNTRWNVFHFDASLTTFVLNSTGATNNVEFIYI